jgi:hypothetical protein
MKTQPVRRRFRPALERLEDRTAPAIVTPFNGRLTSNATADVAGIANTLETATTVGNLNRTQQNVINAQNCVGPGINNDVPHFEPKEPWFSA